MRALLVVLLVASEAAADCPTDAQLTKLIDDALAESARYLGAIDKQTARWPAACDVARKQLLALEPDAKRFVSAMMAFAERGKAMDGACRKRVKEIGEKRPLTRELDKRTTVLKARLDPQLARCKDHPGFGEATTKGLKFMRRKR